MVTTNQSMGLPAVEWEVTGYQLRGQHAGRPWGSTMIGLTCRRTTWHLDRACSGVVYGFGL